MTTNLINDFVLAEKLHCTVAEVRRMDHGEYVQWLAYLDLKRQLRDNG